MAKTNVKYISNSDITNFVSASNVNVSSTNTGTSNTSTSSTNPDINISELNPDKLYSAVENMVKLAIDAVNTAKSFENKRSGISKKISIRGSSNSDTRNQTINYIGLKDAINNLGNSIDYANYRFENFHDALESVGIEINNNSFNNTLNTINVQFPEDEIDFEKVDKKMKELVSATEQAIAKFDTLDKRIGEIDTPSSTTTTTASPTIDPNVGDYPEEEFIVGKEIKPGNVFLSENIYIPSSRQGEIIPIRVGFNDTRRTVFVVTGCHTPEGYHIDRDYICIYSDIITGILIQKIKIYRPSHLTVVYLREISVLAFLENRRILNVYEYRGISGFTLHNRYNLPNGPYKGLSSVTLPNSKQYGCPVSYLIASTKSKLIFLKAFMQGDCGFRFDIDCNHIIQ